MSGRRPTAIRRKVVQVALAAALPFSVFVAHGAFFAGWEIDDAGISYAYARNLMAGDGLVAQPGSAPVEGFTNLLWVAILAGWLPLVESPGTAARALSHVFVFAAFLTLAVGVRSWAPRRWLAITVCGLSATALVTGFPAWTLSGLENGLYAFLLALFVVATTAAPDSRLGGAAVGLVWTLLLATRPDAAPLIALPWIVWAWKAHQRTRASYAVTTIAGFAGLAAFRVAYFGDVLPNTFYAKNATGAELLSGVSWNAASGLLFVLCGAVVLLAGNALAAPLAAKAPWPRGRPPRRVGVPALLVTLAICYLIFETLPTDWMPEGRFATSMFLLGPITLLCLVGKNRGWLAATAAGLLLLLGGYSWGRTPAFAESPPAPFDSVISLSGRLDAVGEALGTGRATEVLLPDIGGALWEDRFVVLDLAGLTDRRIARTLGADDRSGFHDYLFEDRKPDLIWIHGYWKVVASLEADPRFVRDYEILTEDSSQTLYVRSSRLRGRPVESLVTAFRQGHGP